MGRRYAVVCCKKANVDVNKRAGELTEDEVTIYRNIFDYNFIDVFFSSIQSSKNIFSMIRSKISGGEGCDHSDQPSSIQNP